MQRVLRWEIPVDDQWHDIGAGYVVDVASRHYYERPGDLVEVWTLEDTADTNPGDDLHIPMRSVTVVGTGHAVPENTEHVGSAVVATRVFRVAPPLGVAGVHENSTSSGSLVWHVFAKIDPADERQLVPLGHRVDGIVRSAKVETLEDEATSLAYWLANKLGEHVDDQDGETLTQTVGRLLARVVRYTHIATLPCPDCGRHKIIGYRLDDENGNHRHTHYVCRFWGADEPKACGWHGWSVPGWDADENGGDDA